MISVEVLGLDRAVEITDQIERNLSRKLTNVFKRAAIKGMNVMIDLTPIATGLLQSNDVSEPNYGHYSYGFDLKNETEYAKFVCFGTYKMAARDFLTPAAVAAKAYIDANIGALGAV